MDYVLHAVEDDGPRLADVEEALDAQHVLASSVEQHAAPDPDHRPIDGPVERERYGVRIAHVVRVAGLSGEVRRSRGRPVRVEELLDVHLSEGRLDNLGGWVYRAQPRDQPPNRARLRYVRLGHDDLVGRRNLLDRLRVAVEMELAVDRVHGGENQVDGEVVLQDGIG